MKLAVEHIRAVLKALSERIMNAREKRATLAQELSDATDRERKMLQEQTELLSVLQLIERPATETPEE